MKWISPAIATLGLLTSACADIESGDIRTSGICATITATNSSNNKIDVEATLTAGCGLGGSYVVLDSGEDFTAQYLSNSYSLSRSTDWITNITHYVATTNADYAAGEQLTVSLDRPTGYVDAPNSYVTLPSGFNITAPANGTPYTAGDSITIDWTGTTADRIHLDMTCLEDITADTVHTSISRTPTSIPYTIPVSELDAIINDPSDSIGHVSSCNGTLSVIRTQVGAADPALDPQSHIYGRFVDRRNFSLSL